MNAYFKNISIANMKNVTEVTAFILKISTICELGLPSELT